MYKMGMCFHHSGCCGYVFPSQLLLWVCVSITAAAVGRCFYHSGRCMHVSITADAAKWKDLSLRCCDDISRTRLLWSGHAVLAAVTTSVEPVNCEAASHAVMTSVEPVYCEAASHSVMTSVEPVYCWEASPAVMTSVEPVCCEAATQSCCDDINQTS